MDKQNKSEMEIFDVRVFLSLFRKEFTLIYSAR